MCSSKRRGASGTPASRRLTRFAALGARVTIVGGTHLLSALDVEMAQVLAESFNGLGIRVIPKVTVSRVERVGELLHVTLADGRTLQVQKVLVAAGRCPQIEGLGLADVGIALDPTGWVRVDERYATTAPGVFAAGDVIGPPSLAAVAFYNNYKDRPSGPRAPHSLMYMGVALDKLGRKADACKAFRELDEVYGDKAPQDVRTDAAAAKAKAGC